MICWTCRRQPAVQVAMAAGDEWPVCGSCVRQSKRTRAKVAHRQFRPGESWEDPPS